MAGRVRSLFDWSGSVSDVHFTADGTIVTRRDGSVHTHRRTSDGWNIDIVQGGDVRTVRLGGAVPSGGEGEAAVAAAAPDRSPLLVPVATNPSTNDPRAL